ncbi:MAG: nucleotidyltransferase domain-containing protein [Microthrixaceae bacterium]
MSARRAVVESKRNEINDLVRQHHGRTAALFGSVARGDDTPESDIDFLVEFEPGSSLFDLMDLQEALEQLLGVSVDVVSVGGLKDRDEHIRREAVPI